MPGRWVGRWMSWYGRRRRRGAIIDLLLSSSSSWISREVAALFVCLAVGRSLSLSLSLTHTHTHIHTHTLSLSLSAKQTGVNAARLVQGSPALVSIPEETLRWVGTGVDREVGKRERGRWV